MLATCKCLEGVASAGDQQTIAILHLSLNVMSDSVGGLILLSSLFQMCVSVMLLRMKNHWIRYQGSCT